MRETVFDEVFDSQKTFRILLQAMSRPGRIGRLPPQPYQRTPSGLNPFALTVLKTLCDHEVSIGVGGRPEWAGYLAANTGSPLRPAAEADYVLLDGSVFDEAFLRLRRGSLEFPERGALALLAVRALSENGGPGCRLTIRGPGVEAAQRLGVEGLDGRYPQALAGLNELFPLGLDCCLLDREGRLACLPRSCRVEVD
jgi:alpha-D-ribose 1-methylphosphonate 5-triphosphate synthase subunit PhnH